MSWQNSSVQFVEKLISIGTLDVAATLPAARSTSAIKAEIASGILAYAAKGERDPVALRKSALLAVVEYSHYSHNLSPERRAV
jgi:hypothetical protein